MPQSLPSLLYHIIYSTKHREPFIDEALEAQLHAYLAGICTSMGGRPISINGMADHVHVFTYLPPKIAVSDALRDLKASSSKWVHKTFADKQAFAWQAGFGAFSVSRSMLAKVRGYVVNQKTHHASKSFQDEYREFLQRHGVEWDERYVWD